MPYKKAENKKTPLNQNDYKTNLQKMLSGIEVPYSTDLRAVYTGGNPQHQKDLTKAARASGKLIGKLKKDLIQSNARPFSPEAEQAFNEAIESYQSDVVPRTASNIRDITFKRLNNIANAITSAGIQENVQDMSRGVYLPDERSGKIETDVLLEPIDERSGNIIKEGSSFMLKGSTAYNEKNKNKKQIK